MFSNPHLDEYMQVPSKAYHETRAYLACGTKTPFPDRLHLVMLTASRNIEGCLKWPPSATQPVNISFAGSRQQEAEGNQNMPKLESNFIPNLIHVS